MNKQDILICHLGTSHHPNDNRIYKNQAKSLDSAGYKVAIVTPQDNNFSDKSIIFKASGGGFSPLSRLLSTAPKVIDEAIGLNADIYHLHDIELLRFAPKLKKNGAKVIFDSHENWVDYVEDIKWLNTFAKFLGKLYVKYLMLRFLKYCDCVVGVSPHIIRNLEIYHKKVYQITNYPRISEKLNSGNLSDYISRGRVMIYTGTISNQENIIKALPLIKDIKYFMVGNIDDAYLEELRKLEGFKFVEYYKYIPQEQLYNLYNKARVAINALNFSANVGYSEGTLGNTKLFDYMKYSLPIACTNFTLWKNIVVDEYECGTVFDPNSPESIASAIEFILNNPERGFLMGTNSLRAAKEKYNWESQELILLEMYRELTLG